MNTHLSIRTHLAKGERARAEASRVLELRRVLPLGACAVERSMMYPGISLGMSLSVRQKGHNVVALRFPLPITEINILVLWRGATSRLLERGSDGVISRLGIIVHDQKGYDASCVTRERVLYGYDGVARSGYNPTN